MRVKVNEGHLRPPVADRLFAEPCFESIESNGKLLGPLPLPVIRRPFLKEQSLLSVGSQAGHAERKGPEPDATTHTFVEERHGYRREVTLPTRFRLNPFLPGDFDLIGVPDRNGQASTNTALIT